MKAYCQNPLCENRSAKKVPVSVDKPADQTRALCATCKEAYTWGVQHGKMIVRGEKLWVLVVVHAGVLSHIWLSRSKSDVEKSLFKYLRRYHDYKGKYETKAAYEWLSKHDEYLSVTIDQQDINAGQ